MPVVWHWFDFDPHRAAAGSALAVGAGCAAFGWLHQGWGIGLLVFFLAACVEYGVAFIVGLVYRAFASAERTDYAERVMAIPVSNRRVGLTGMGALAISLAVASVWIAQGVRTGDWPWTPQLVLGWCAFFGLGVVHLAQFIANRSRAPKQDGAPE